MLIMPHFFVCVFCLYVREVPYAQSVCFVLFPLFDLSFIASSFSTLILLVGSFDL